MESRSHIVARRHTIRAASVAIAAVAATMGATPVEATTFKASIAPIKITAKPGQVVTTTYRLTLEDGEPRAHFKVDVQDWWRSEDGKQSFYATGGSLARSCARWASANPVEAAASGGETLQVRLTITVPDTVKSGGYWCALSVDEMPDPLAVSADGVGVRFLASVSTGIYVNIDPIERGVEILGVDVKGDDVMVRMLNTGNAPASVEGRFEFIKPGAPDSSATIVDLPRNILLTEPIATGQFAVTLPSASTLPSGHYLVRLIVDIGLDHYIGIQRELDLHRSEAAGKE